MEFGAKRRQGHDSLAIISGTNTRRDYHSIRTSAGAIGNSSNALVASDGGPSRGSLAAHEDSVSYHQYSLSCGGDCLGGDAHLC